MAKKQPSLEKVVKGSLLANIQMMGYANVIRSWEKGKGAAILDEWRAAIGDDKRFLQELYGLNNLIRAADQSRELAKKILGELHPDDSETFSSIRYKALNLMNDLEELPFRNLADKARGIRDLQTLEECLALADECEGELRGLFDAHDLAEEDYYSDVDGVDLPRLIPDDLETFCHDARLINRVDRGGVRETMTMGPYVSDIAKAVRAPRNERHYRELMGHLDRERLKADTLMFGAKGANLMVLQSLLPAINQIMAGVEVPLFNLLSVELYRKWKVRESIENDLRGFYDDMADKDIFVRSSAVFSEDEESSTGAGI